MITRVATWEKAEQGKAVLLEVDGKMAEIKHGDLTTFNTAAKVKSELERQVGKILDDVYVHINRDGSLAMGRWGNRWRRRQRVEQLRRAMGRWRSR